MSGFRAFILRGNLVELAVAFIMATAFAAVVTAFTGVLMGFIGKAGGQPDFSDVTLAEVNVGIFLGTGVLQPCVGWVLDRGREAGDLPGAWDRGLLVLAGAAAFGAAASFVVGARLPAKP